MTTSSSYISTRLFRLLACIVVFCFICAESCYITECPNSVYYGRRRAPPPKRTRSGIPQRKCPPCGLRGTGQCFSSRMCCTLALGCVVGDNEITAPCRYEADMPSACSSAGPACIRRDREKGNVEVPGICAADGLCCNADGCSNDHRCTIAEKEGAEEERPSVVPSDSTYFRSLVGGLMKKFRSSPTFKDYPEDRDTVQLIKKFRNLRLRRDPVLLSEDGLYKV